MRCIFWLPFPPPYLLHSSCCVASANVLQLYLLVLGDAYLAAVVLQHRVLSLHLLKCTVIHEHDNGIVPRQLYICVTFLFCRFVGGHV